MYPEALKALTIGFLDICYIIPILLHLVDDIRTYYATR